MEVANVEAGETAGRDELGVDSPLDVLVGHECLRSNQVADEGDEQTGTDYQLRKPARTLGQHGHQRRYDGKGEPGDGGERVETQLGPAVGGLV